MPDIKLRHAAVLAAVLGAAGPAAAQLLPQPPGVRYEVRAWPDAAVAAVGLALSALPAYLSDSVASPCPCDPARLLRPDRWAVGPLVGAASTWSYVTLGATVGLGGAGLLLARRGEPGEAAAEDMAVYSEALLVTSGLTQAAKAVVGRARPYLYDASPEGRIARDDAASFPSGHASAAFAAAAAYWSVQERRGQADRRRPQIIGLFSLATATAVLRVVAHKHFPTDVLAGAVLGTAAGWALPQVHPVR